VRGEIRQRGRKGLGDGSVGATVAKQVAFNHLASIRQASHLAQWV
jgi:hypothetical protein